MTTQTDRLIEEVQSKNKAENYHKQNTYKLHKAKDIYKAMRERTLSSYTNCKTYGKKLISLIILPSI